MSLFRTRRQRFCSILFFGLTFILFQMFIQNVARVSAEPFPAWSFEDPMDSSVNWTPWYSVIYSGEGYQYFNDGHGIYRDNVVSFPFTLKVRLKTSPDLDWSDIYISDGTKLFFPTFLPDRIAVGNGTTAFMIDNTQWQEYLLVAHNSNLMSIYVLENGTWMDTGLREQSIDYSYSQRNTVLFYLPIMHQRGTLYVDDVKYINQEYIPENISSPTINPDQNGDGVVDLFDMVQVARSTPQFVAEIAKYYGTRTPVQ